MERQERERRNDLIRARLAEGASATAIAEELGVSLTVVSQIALGAGYRSRPGPPLKYDWQAIRRYYEEGHTKRECRERFGFSSGAWRQAVLRGDVVPRPRPDPVKHSHRVRREVERRLAAGETQAQIARALGLSKGTIAFPVRNLGIAPDARFARRFDWAEIRSAYEAGMTARECCDRFGCSPASWSQAIARGDIVPRPRQQPLADVLALGRKRNRYHVKARLLRLGLKKSRCERCRLTEWDGKPIPLELHHVNGDPRDNRLESLQLLCPNCHSQTENFGRRNAAGNGTDPRAA